jgi:hypothetical protein
MYDMYYWNEPGAAATGAPGRSSHDEMHDALQFALDRRDNGGDAQRPQ